METTIFKSGDYISRIGSPNTIYIVEPNEDSFNYSVKHYGYYAIYKIKRTTGKKYSSVEQYVYVNKTYSFRDHERAFELTENIYSKETKMANSTPTLYSFVDGGVTKYGHHIGTNSSNKLLIEEKGTGQIHVLDKTDLEEVLPFTFSVTYVDTVPASVPTEFIGEPDKFKKGELLIFKSRSKMHFCTVKEIDTKSRTATATFKGYRVPVDVI